MESLELNTDIHCQNCVNKLAPHLDGDSHIHHWKVDLDSPEKKLIVEGDGISQELVAGILGKEGYHITSAIAAPVPEKGFWTDNEKWKRAGFNTLNCLIGCSIGDFGMILFLQAYYPGTSMAVQMVLAIIAGLTTSVLLETIILKVREKFNWSLALKTALGMSFISMIVMELAMNITDFFVTGGKASFNDPMYWMAFGIAAIAGFLAPLPYNYYKLKKFNQACH